MSKIEIGKEKIDELVGWIMESERLDDRTRGAVEETVSHFFGKSKSSNSAIKYVIGLLEKHGKSRRGNARIGNSASDEPGAGGEAADVLQNLFSKYGGRGSGGGKEADTPVETAE